jgi:hypothetical protein
MAMLSKVRQVYQALISRTRSLAFLGGIHPELQTKASRAPRPSFARTRDPVQRPENPHPANRFEPENMNEKGFSRLPGGRIKLLKL